MDIMLSNANLVISIVKVQGCDVRNAMQSIKHLINTWQGIPVIDALLVQQPEIDTKSTGTILFLNKNDRGTIRGSGGFNIPFI